MQHLLHSPLESHNHEMRRRALLQSLGMLYLEVTYPILITLPYTLIQREAENLDLPE